MLLVRFFMVGSYKVRITLIILLNLFINFSLLAQNTAIKIQPQLQTIGVDSSGTVQVRIENVQQLHAYSIEITYNPDLLRFIELTRLDFLSNWQTFYYPFIDTIIGKIKVDEAILGPYAQSGSGNLFKVKFTGKQEGDCQINITVSELRDLNNQSISPQLNNGLVIIRLLTTIREDYKTEYSRHRLNIFPNPFNSSTNILLSAQNGEEIILRIFNINGQMAFQLNTFVNSKETKISWDGNDNYGQKLPSGVYFLQMQSKDVVLHEKLFLLK